jgi:hypothetical protein
MEWEGYALSGSFSRVHEAPLHVVLTNLGDSEHVPFVHPGLLLDEGRLRETEVTTRHTEDQVEVRVKHPTLRSRLSRLPDSERKESFVGELITRFDPPRLMFTAYRDDARMLEPRETIKYRSVSFVVPESEKRTSEHVFLFWQLPRTSLRPLVPVLGWLGSWVLRRQDARVISAAADVPFDTKGMRLDRFDQGLVRILEGLKRIYLAPEEEAQPVRETKTPRPLEM